MTDKPTIEDCMEQAQIFASAWSLVGCRVFGKTMENATAEKEALEAMLRAALAAPAPAELAVTACYFPGKGEADLTWERNEDGARFAMTVKVTEDQGKALSNVVYPCIFWSASTAAPAQVQDDAFEAVRLQLCRLERYSFLLDDNGGVRRVRDRVGNWIEFDAAHELFDPVAVDAAIAAQKGGAV